MGSSLLGTGTAARLSWIRVFLKLTHLQSFQISFAAVRSGKGPLRELDQFRGRDSSARRARGARTVGSPGHKSVV